MRYLPSFSGGLAALLAAAVAGCGPWEVPAPPRTEVGARQPSIAESEIGVTLEVKLTDVSAFVMQEYGSKPLFAQRSAELTGTRVRLQELQTLETVEKIVVVPFEAAKCITTKAPSTCGRDVTRRVRERCVDGFFKKPFDCFKTIIETEYLPCMKDVTTCTPEVKEVLENVVRTTQLPIDVLAPTSVWLDTRVDLKGLALDAKNDTLSGVARLDIDVAADINQRVLAANQTIKGALNCTSQLEVPFSVAPTLRGDGTVEFELKGIGVDVERLCFPAVVDLIDHSVLGLQASALELALRKPVTQALQRALERELKGLSVAAALERLGAKLAEPRELDGGIVVEFRPQRIELSQLRGRTIDGASALAIEAFVVATPRLHLGPPAKGPPPEVRINPEGPRRNDFHVSAEAAITMQEASTILEERLRATTKTLRAHHKLPNLPYSLGKVEVYQSGERLAVSLEIRNSAGDRHAGDLYLLATPKLEPDRSVVRITNVQFDASTRDFLLRNAAALLDGTIEQLIEEEGVFPYRKLLQEARARANPFVERKDGLEFSVWVDALDVEDLWVGRGALHVVARAPGRTRLRWAPSP